jgi:hypothetical protein
MGKIFSPFQNEYSGVHFIENSVTINQTEECNYSFTRKRNKTLIVRHNDLKSAILTLSAKFNSLSPGSKHFISLKSVTVY